MASTTFTFDFNLTPYSSSHGCAPRGYGSWAFAFEGREPIFSPAMTLRDAKKWAKAEARKVAPAGFAGEVTIDVLP